MWLTIYIPVVTQPKALLTLLVAHSSMLATYLQKVRINLKPS